MLELATPETAVRPVQHESAITEVIEAYGLGYHLGVAMNRLLRAGRWSGLPPAGCDLREAERHVTRWRQMHLQHWAGSPGVGFEPMGLESTKVADRFGLEGSHRFAVVEILDMASSSIDDAEVRSRRALLHIEHAIEALA